MRNCLILAVLAAMAMTTSEAQANRRLVGGSGRTVSSGERPFSRLMEMERRKNAALRGMFQR